MIWVCVSLFCLYLVVGAVVIEISKERARSLGYHERNLFEISRWESLGGALFCWAVWPLYVKVMLEHVPPTMRIGEYVDKLLTRLEKLVRRVSGRRPV